MEQKLKPLCLPASVSFPATLTSLKVETGDHVRNGTLLATYSCQGSEEEEDSMQFKSTTVGRVRSVLCKEGDTLQPKYDYNSVVIYLKVLLHFMDVSLEMFVCVCGRGGGLKSLVFPPSCSVCENYEGLLKGNLLNICFLTNFTE